MKKKTRNIVATSVATIFKSGATHIFRRVFKVLFGQIKATLYNDYTSIA
jgi:hypothetical protein